MPKNTNNQDRPTDTHTHTLEEAMLSQFGIRSLLAMVIYEIQECRGSTSVHVYVIAHEQVQLQQIHS